MNRKAAKLIRKYAAATGDFDKRRVMKRSWQTFSHRERFDLRKKMERLIREIDKHEAEAAAEPTATTEENKETEA